MTTNEEQQQRRKHHSADVQHESSSSNDNDLSDVVRGTAESVLSKLEGDLDGMAVDESELLQATEPGPMDKEGKDVEDVLNVISQSIYREAEGERFPASGTLPTLL